MLIITKKRGISPLSYVSVYAQRAREPVPTIAPALLTQQSQITPHLAYAKDGPLGKGQIYFSHQNLVHSWLALGRAVQAGAGNAEQIALPDNPERDLAVLHHALPAGDAHRFPQALAKKSRSTVSWPILACNPRSFFPFGFSGLDFTGKYTRDRILDLLDPPVNLRLVNAKFRTQFGDSFLTGKGQQGYLGP